MLFRSLTNGCTQALCKPCPSAAASAPASATTPAVPPIVFLKGIAGDLNRLGTWGTGYGLLRKSSGSSCGGYSCDIICQGTGTSQKQYDVLIDSDRSAASVRKRLSVT